VLALHQAGIRNAVGLMGTALTDEQVGGLARMAPTVLLALDADGAGKEAMLRAATLAAKRKLELRVIPLPAGADPAELLQSEGPAAIERAIGESVPFVRFRVERILESGDHGSAEGRERILTELRGVFATLPQGTTRMELTRIVSERLDLPQSLAERALGAKPSLAVGAGAREQSVGEREGARAPALAGVAARGERTELAFLAQCIAEPQEGARALAALDPEEHFTSDVLRRAAHHLREHLADPGAGLADDDPTMAGALAELVVAAAKEQPKPGMLETQRMQLELARLERRIRAARAEGSGEVSDLARRRIEVKREFERAYERALAETGG
jgi:DNA primase